MASAFSSLHESLQQVLSQRLQWTGLREVQEAAYRAVSAGSDALILAPTAGGKSEAALIPVMDDILKNGRSGVACLYISPLKALINDQEERFSAFCVPTSLYLMKWHVDVPKGDRSGKEEPPHFLMITPESLEVLLQEKELARDLAQVRFIIVDELHAFVESGRGVHLKVLMERMDRLAKRKIQRIGLSATTGNPEEILRWLSDSRHGEEIVSVPSSPKEKHFRFVIEPEEGKRRDAIRRTVAGKKALVFVSSRSLAEHLVQSLEGQVHNLYIHHSSLAPATRRAAEDAFSSPEGACIVCTSTLELGIDIGDLDVVVQVGPPDSVSSFLQRMGRSGRRGSAASVTWVLQDPREFLCSLAIIESAMEKDVEPLRPQALPYNVLLQQLFLMLLSRKQATRREVIREVSSYRAFAGLDRRDPDRIISHLIGNGFLAADGEVLMPGTEAERVLGRSNWKDLYSVISGGGEYRAVTPDGEVVGKLDARFVNTRESGDVTLGGRNWSMVKADEGHNIVVVVPGGPAPSRTFWAGSGVAGYSPLICKKVREIVERRRTLLPLGDGEQEILGTALASFPPELAGEGLCVCSERDARGSGVAVWSFAGRKVNRVLALLLVAELGSRAQVRYDEFTVRIRRAGRERPVERVSAALSAIGTWDMQRIAAALPLPPADGWKFASLLPHGLFARFVASEYYDLDAFREAIAGPGCPPATGDTP